MSSGSLLALGSLPPFPNSLVISTSAIVNAILADVPFFTNGLLGLAVVAFFIMVRRGNKFIYLVVAATFVAFVASLMDLSQLLTRGNFAVQTGQNVAQVLALLVAREVGLSLFPGLFFLFFWFYVALPPRGELEKPYGGRSYSYDLGIIHYPEAYHSARWDRWGYVGDYMQWLLLGAVIAVPVLQAVWRLSAFAVVFGPIYNASATLEIILASMFALKILGNVWLSPLTPMLRTVRDYLPVLVPLVISLAVSIMNTVFFKFAESPLGRLMQAAQCYFLVIYILTATFYGELVVKIKRSDSIDNARPESLFRPAPPVPNNSREEERQKAGSQNSGGTLGMFTNWFSRSRSRLSTPSNMENGERRGSSDEKTETKYMDSYYFNEAPFQLAPGQQAQAQDSGSKPTSREPAVGVAVEGPSPKDDGRMGTVPAPYRQEDALTENRASPVYGQNGVVGNVKYLSGGRSSQSSDMSALLRQQAELDKSVAGLQMYSSITDRPGGVSPTQSDFSLSKFPEPPFAMSSDQLSDGGSERSAISGVTAAVNNGDRFTVDNMEFALVPPRMPAAAASAADRLRGPSGVSTATSRSSYNIDSVIGRMNRFDSVGTQYDVTSFIGGLTAPVGPGQTAQQANPSNPSNPPTTGTTSLTPIQSESEGSTPRSPNLRPPIQPLVTRTGLKTITPAPSQLPVARRPPPQGPRRPVLNLTISQPKVREVPERNSDFERPRPPPSTSANNPAKAI